MFKFLLIVAILALSISNSLQQYDEEVVALDGSSPSATGGEQSKMGIFTWENSEGKIFEIPYDAEEFNRGPVGDVIPHN